MMFNPPCHETSSRCFRCYSDIVPLAASTRLALAHSYVRSLRLRSLGCGSGDDFACVGASGTNYMSVSVCSLARGGEVLQSFAKEHTDRVCSVAMDEDTVATGVSMRVRQTHALILSSLRLRPLPLTRGFGLLRLAVARPHDPPLVSRQHLLHSYSHWLRRGAAVPQLARRVAAERREYAPEGCKGTALVDWLRIRRRRRWQKQCTGGRDRHHFWGRWHPLFASSSFRVR